MTDKILDEPVDEHIETTPERARQGLRGTHVLAILALSTFLASVGLITFFIVATASH